MIVTLNEKIVFDVREQTVSDNASCIRLSGPACRILLVLLENNHKEVTRTVLLQKVWEDMGLEPSENSLNTNISLLRKNLSEFGLTDIIKTLPKTGFILHLNHVDFEIITPLKEGETGVQLQIAVESTATSDELNFKEKLTLNKFAFPFAILGVTILTSLLTFFSFLLQPMLSQSEDDYYFYKRIDKCLVYYIKGINKEDLSVFFDGALGKPVVAGCDHPALLYYDETSSYKVKNTLNTIVSRCKMNHDGIVDECKNYVSDSHK